MSQRDRWRLGADILVLLVLVTAWISSRDLVDKARLFPTAVVGAGILLIILVMVLDWFRRRKQKDQPEADPAGMDLQPGDRFALSDAVRKSGLQFSWVFGAVGAAFLFGPLIPLPAFVLLHMRFSGQLSWRASLLAAFLFAAFLILVFELLMNMSWPRGMVPEPQAWLLGIIDKLVDGLN